MHRHTLDDRLLSCALSLQRQEGSAARVVLCTADSNLTNKAIAAKLEAMTAAELIGKLRVEGDRLLLPARRQGGGDRCKPVGSF